MVKIIYFWFGGRYVSRLSLKYSMYFPDIQLHILRINFRRLAAKARVRMAVEAVADASPSTTLATTTGVASTSCMADMAMNTMADQVGI